MSRQPLVIGVGNPDRGDDAVGLRAAGLVRNARVAMSRDCSTLMTIWDEEDDVTVIDATVSGASPGTITRFDGLTQRLPTATFPSTHSIGLAESIELARAIGRLPRTLTIFGIEAGGFELGSSLTPSVEGAAKVVASIVDEENL